MIFILTEQAPNSDNSEDGGENSTADEKEDDNGDDGWDSDASGPSHLEDLYGGDYGHTLDAAVIRNHTYLVAKHDDCIDEQDGGDSESENFACENEGTKEKSYDESSLHQNKLIQDCSTETQNHKPKGSKSHLCDATFVIGSHEVHLSLRKQSLSSVDCNPASVVPPNTKGCLINDEINSDSYCNRDLVNAVLCYRNKIALVLAGISQEKQPRSSQGSSKEATRGTGGKLVVSNQTSKKSHFCFMEKNVEHKVNDRCESKASAITSLVFEREDKGEKASDSEGYRSPYPTSDRPRPSMRRQSMTIIPASSPAKTLKHDVCNTVKPDVSPPTLKRRSMSLCQLNGPANTVGYGKDPHRCMLDSLSTSAGSKAVGDTFSNLLSPAAQRLVSPAHSSKPLETLRRRSSQLLRVSESATSTVKMKKEVLKGAYFEQGCTFSDNVKESLKIKDRLRHSSDDVEAEQSSPKRIIRDTCGGRFAKRSSSSRPVVSAQQKLNELLGCCEAGVDKGNGSRTQDKRSPNSRKSRGANVLKNNCDPVISTPRLTYLVEVNGNKKSESDPLEVDNNEHHALLSINTGAVAKTGNAAKATVLFSQKKSCSYSGFDVFNAQRTNDNGGIGDVRNNDKKKVADIRRPLSIRSSKEGISTKEAIQLLCKTGVEREGSRTAMSCVSNPRRSTSTRIVQSGKIRNELSSPLVSQLRKKRARESVTLDTPGSLPRKQPKRGWSMPSSVELELSSFDGLESLSWQRRESTPVKRKSVKRLKIDKFSPQNIKLWSPFRRPVAPFPTQGSVVSPCKGPTSCDKSFCFDCC